jgi:hypothetical protein
MEDLPAKPFLTQRRKDREGKPGHNDLNERKNLFCGILLTLATFA